MRKLLSTTILAASLCLPASAALAKGQLSIFHWFEYIPQEVLDKFSEEFDVDVTMDTYSNNEEMLAKLKAGGIGTYDVSVPGDYMVQIMRTEGLLDTIAPGELSNKGNIMAEWANTEFDPGRKHSIPYQWGSTSFQVNTELYKKKIDSVAVLFDPPAALSGRINMLDSQSEVMLMASLYMGIPQCSQDRHQLLALNDMLQNSKHHWASFNSDNARESLESGDVHLTMIFDGMAAKARRKQPHLHYLFPKEGYPVWMDNVVLLKDAPNRANAIKFMDFLLRPEIIAQITNWTNYSSGVEGTEKYLKPDLATQPETNPPHSAGMPVFVKVCDQKTQEVYDKIWTNLKK